MSWNRFVNQHNLHSLTDWHFVDINRMLLEVANIFFIFITQLYKKGRIFLAYLFLKNQFNAKFIQMKVFQSLPTKTSKLYLAIFLSTFLRSYHKKLVIHHDYLQQTILMNHKPFLNFIFIHNEYISWTRASSPWLSLDRVNSIIIAWLMHNAHTKSRIPSNMESN